MRSRTFTGNDKDAFAALCLRPSFVGLVYDLRAATWGTNFDSCARRTVVEGQPPRLTVSKSSGRREPVVQ